MASFSYDQYIQHFSHPHQLQLNQTDPHQTLYRAPCSGCNLQSSGWMYTCKPCNFTLHVSCAQMPQQINHPSHPHHSLTLLSTPIYRAGLFECDGCGNPGHGFSYHCDQCHFDLHILCASKPPSLTHHSHACELMLTFDPPYQNKCFTCDVCRGFGSNHWLYRCSTCAFDAHLNCAAANVINAARPVAQTRSQVHMQHYNSLIPGPNHVQNDINIPGGIGMNQQYYVQGHQQQATAAPSLSGRVLMCAAAVVQEFVEGATQQLGQNFVQSMTNLGQNFVQSMTNLGNDDDPGNNDGMVFDTDDSDSTADNYY